MKVVGFSFIRNAGLYDYPIVEAITSVLPLCDEFIISVGKSDDNTLELIRAIPSGKIRIVHSVWDDSLREGGRVLAAETDKAYAAVPDDADWVFYIQGDEVLHEKYLPVIRSAMEEHLGDSSVEGLLLRYLHFYGSYDYVGDSRKWYRREIRIIRKSDQIVSYRDAQGFRTRDNRKLRVKPVEAWMYHYGWVKTLEKQKAKIRHFSSFWHGEEQMSEVDRHVEAFDYSQIDSLAAFEGTHPAVMHPRIDRMAEKRRFNTTVKKYSVRVRALTLIEKWSGWRIGEYKNYRIQ
jgi:glycosyltransferase involved in cell wall biosynthesis